ncbi:MAG: RNA polymerase sigma-70 factor [Micromonosporaceae bacterium]|nr:RNA polymerase sigma-70 factor [Micromonosporaceae bacterium]
MHAELRPLIFSVAYGMLGSVAEAEDVTQEALLRLHRTTTPVESPAAYAVTMATRLAIDELRSARRRREMYVGSWLPEPLVTADPAHDPAEHVAAAQRLSTALLVMLERLSPVERAVLLLREVFEYDYPRIAEIVGRSVENCRQILARARTRVHEPRSRFEAAPQRHDELVSAFLDACRTGDLAALEKLLAEDVTFTGDGGGKVASLAVPATGRQRVARFLLGLFRQAHAAGLEVEAVPVNGQPGLRVRDRNGATAAVMSIAVSGAGIAGLYSVLNPDKLRHLQPFDAVR